MNGVLCLVGDPKLLTSVDPDNQRTKRKEVQPMDNRQSHAEKYAPLL